MSSLRRVVLVTAIGAVAANCDNQDLNGLWPWQKSWGWLGQGYRRCRRSSAGQQSPPSGPVMVIVGPAISEERPREFDAFPVQAYENTPAFALKVVEGFDLLPRLLGSFRGFFEQTPRIAGFKLQSNDEGFGLLATLPGYEAGSGKQDRILSVHILGDRLVVRGQRWLSQLAYTFQRSFLLPKSADISKVSAVYKALDGSLEVALPVSQHSVRPDEGQGQDGWRHNPQDGGSHTSLTFSAELVEHNRPALRGASSMQEDIVPLLRQTMDFADSLVDQYVGPADEGAAGTASLTTAMGTSPALVVQPKSAQPYWRLRNGVIDADAGTPSLEVVAPWGADLGSPDGRMVPMYNATVIELPRRPIGHVVLPVAVSSSDCSWMGASAHFDRVLRCALGADVMVKQVQIQSSAQEL